MDHELFNDNDNFEQFLRDSTEDFKMYPSRKVWYSLYNNLHPGRKWPSLAVCLILVSAILFMDVSNNNKINKRTQDAVSTPVENYFTSYFTQFQNKKPTAVLLPVITKKQRESKNIITSTYNNSNSILIENNNSLYLNDVQNISGSLENNIAQNFKVNINQNTPAKVINNQANLKNENAIVDNNSYKVLINSTAVLEDDFSLNANNLNKVVKSNLKETNNHFESLLMKAYQDDHAFYNKPRRNKFMKNASLQFYITPSVGYRALFKNKDVKFNNNALIAVNPNQAEAEAVNQNAAYNMEVGMALNYSVSEKLRLKMGVQFNSTNYVINAGQLFHPTQANLLLENNATGISNLEPHTSYYSNRQTSGNDARLFNKTTQFSLPIGMDYKIGSKKNISWYAGASIQPTYIATGEANVLSADARNYVKMPSLLRSWNANTSFETFVSIETKAGFAVNVGPQFRYQLLSTYNKEYNYTEKLYNIGIKLGITRGF